MKRAFVVSLAARMWGALLSILVVPLYIRFLGIEAYGLVGIFTSVQVLVSFLDLGLGATLIRELARLSGAERQLRPMRDLTWTFEVVYLGTAVLLGIVLALLAPLLAGHWVHLQHLSLHEAQRALVLAALALAAQWPSTLYNAGLTGLQRQATLGGITALMATLRVAATLLVLWKVAPTIEMFFVVQALSALAQTFVTRWALWRGLAGGEGRARFHFAKLREARSFAGKMTGIAITAIILTQTDKIILSHVLPLGEFGTYALASTLASGLYVAIGPVFNIIYPRFSAIVGQQGIEATAPLYHVSAQFMSALVVPVAVVGAFFSKDILFAWTGNAALSEQARWLFALLLLGNAMNGVMNIPYALQLGAGWTGLALWANVIALLVVTPLTYFLATSLGALGGAIAWCVLNACYIVFSQTVMHRRLLLTEKWRWYINDVGVAVLVAAMIAGVIWPFVPDDLSRLGAGLTPGVVWCLAAISTAVALPQIKHRLVDWLRHLPSIMRMP